MNQQQQPNTNPTRAQLIHETSIVEKQRQLAHQLNASKQKQRATVEMVPGETDQQRLLRLALQAKKHSTKQQQPANTNTGKKKKRRKSKKKTNSGFQADSVVSGSQAAPTDLLGNALSVTASKGMRKTNIGTLYNSDSDAPGKKLVVGHSDKVALGSNAEPIEILSSSPVVADKVSSQTHKRPALKRTSSNSVSVDSSNVSSSNVLKRARILRKKADTSSDQAHQNRLTRITIDDYWRAIRLWDFQADVVAEINMKKELKSRKKTNPATATKGFPNKSDSTVASKGSTPSDEIGRELSTPPPGSTVINLVDDKEDGEDEEGELSEAVPDTFSSSLEYINIWSPLLIDEMKANLLSEVQGNKALNKIDWCNLPKGCSLTLSCAALMRDIGTSTDYVTVQLRSKKQQGGQSIEGEKKEYILNDIVLLVGPNKQSRQSIVGHVEYSRKSVDGLMIKVSRQLWTSIGCEDMYLVYLGSNITAIR